MKRIFVSLLSLLVLVPLLSGCPAPPEPGAETAAGRGQPGPIVAGGVFGVLAGGAIGSYSDVQLASRQEAIRRYAGNQPPRLLSVRIVEALIEPPVIHSGGEVGLRLAYAVLTPAPDSSAEVVETREVRYRGDIVAAPIARSVRTGGAFSSVVPLRLPEGAPVGRYRVVSFVRAGSIEDRAETSFDVVR